MQWGAWVSIGMVAGNVAVHRAMRRSGVGMVRPRQGLQAMQQLLSSASSGACPAQLAAIPFAWRAFLVAPRNANAFFYGEHLLAVQQLQQQQQQPLSGAQSLAAVLERRATMPAALPAVPSAGRVLQQVLVALLAVHGSALDAHQPLVQAGLDSLGERQCSAPDGAAVVCACSPS